MNSDLITLLDADASLDAGQRVAALVASYFARAHAGEGAVSTRHTPAELAARFDEPMPMTGVPLDDVLARIERDVYADANRLAHPMAFGHQLSAPLPAAVWAEAITASMNQSIAVREMSPTLTAVEGAVLRWMCDVVGYGARSGGTMTSGGTEATFTSLLAARAHALPNAWSEGVGANPPVVLCGEHTHYAVTRAVAQLGLGYRSVLVVPSREFRMDEDVLESMLATLEREGRRVMAVVATAGSTATGSFDRLDAIADSCERRGVWLHVDGAHGASALLSPAHRHRVRGIERARTIAWDPHKMMLLPVAAGMVLAREERDLDAAFAQRAPYLFHDDDGSERVIDQGVRSFQCSRRGDALKVWVALQRYGASGIAALYDGLCDTARALWSAIGERPDFVALHEPECNILCFRWVGDGTLDDARLDAVNLATREAYNRSGHGWITTTLLGGRRVLRVTVMNPRTTAGHVESMLAEVGRVAQRIVEG